MSDLAKKYFQNMNLDQLQRAAANYEKQLNDGLRDKQKAKTGDTYAGCWWMWPFWQKGLEIVNEVIADKKKLLKPRQLNVFEQ